MPTAEARSPWTRILLGPGPSHVHPRLQLMDETKALLRFVSHTQNTLPLPNHAGKVLGGGAHLPSYGANLDELRVAS